MKQMTLEEISKAAASGAFRKIPVSREIYSDIRTPVETLKVLQGVSSHCYMLESVEDKKQWGRYTFLGYDPSLELTCAQVQKAQAARRAKLSPYHNDFLARSGFPAPMFWAVMAASALAMEVAESMENTSYLLPMPTTAAAYTPQWFITAVR